LDTILKVIAALDLRLHAAPGARRLL